MSDEATRWFEGACHCGRVQFRVRIDPTVARVCDCSLCRRRGALNQRVTPDAIEFLTPLEDLTVYRWHTHTAADHFCPTCGMMPFRRPRTAPSMWTVNLRCLPEVDLERVEITRVRGSRLP